MKAFITGGAGFIGSNLAEHLLSCGREVTVFDNFSTGRQEFVNKNCRLITGSILDATKLSGAMQGHGIVFHLAAHSTVYGTGLQQFVEQNISGTANVLAAMESAGIKKIIFASSQAVYGDCGVPVSENSPANPISHYGSTKLACENIISASCRANGWQAWVLRFANAVGRKQTHGVIFDFVKKLKENKNKLQILGDGAQRKSYLLVDELISAIDVAINNAHDAVNILNVGAPETIDVRTIAKIVAGEMGLAPEFVFENKTQGWPGDQTKIFLDTAKINALGWQSKYSQEETIKIATKQILEDNKTKEKSRKIFLGQEKTVVFSLDSLRF